MSTTTIPHSGDFMRLFARTPMTGAALRVANTLAGYISYDGKFRGAPRGFAAFTMKELQAMTGISGRTIRAALDELARLFGLTIQRRHHDRHLFSFSKVYAADAEVPAVEDLAPAKQADVSPENRVTGSRMPPSLHTRTKSNNDTASTIRILEGAGLVHQTPYAAIIEDAKTGTEAAGMDTQFLWNGFHMLNARNGRATAPLSWLEAFVRKAKPKFQHTPKVPTPRPAPAPAATCADPVQVMARAAPFENRAFHEIDLRRAIGAEAYEQRVTEVRLTCGVGRFAAQLAVHGQAVREGTITP